MDGIADINMRFTEGDNEYSAGYSEVYRLEKFSPLSPLARIHGHHREDDGRASDATSAEGRPRLVPQIH